MNILTFALLLFFVAANVFVEARNPAMHWWDEPLSAYLHGVKFAWVQSLAYLGFALAMLLLGIARAGEVAPAISLYVAAAALVGVVATANLHGVWQSDWRRRLHVVCAGLAFGGALVAEAIFLWGTPDVWFPVGAAAVAVAFARWAPEQHSLEEKVFTAVLVAGFVSLVGVPL